jgi:hypothetical protein
LEAADSRANVDRTATAQHSPQAIESGGELIPHIIHQSWKTTRVRRQWRRFQKKLVRLHPTWEYRFWTDQDNDRLVKDHYPEYLTLYKNAPLPVDRADIARYLYMHACGGFYVDMDYELLRPLDPGPWELILPYSRQLSFGDNRNELDPCVIASRKGHPFWLRLVESLSGRIEEAIRTGKAHDSLFTTGPEAFSGEGFKEKDGVYFPPREVYHPYYHPGNRREYRAIIASGRSMGIHHCSGTWIHRDKMPVRISRWGLRFIKRWTIGVLRRVS